MLSRVSPSFLPSPFSAGQENREQFNLQTFAGEMLLTLRSSQDVAKHESGEVSHLERPSCKHQTCQDSSLRRILKATPPPPTREVRKVPSVKFHLFLRSSSFAPAPADHTTSTSIHHRNSPPNQNTKSRIPETHHTHHTQHDSVEDLRETCPVSSRVKAWRCEVGWVGWCLLVSCFSVVLESG